LFTLIIEAAGMAILFGRFVIDQPVDQALWWSLFHSISAFNNAGFDLTGGFQSLQSHADAVTLLTVSALILLGSVGFLVVEDVLHSNRNTRRLTADSVVVLRTTAILLVTGFLVFLLLESGNLLQGKNVPERLLHSFFNSVSHRTAGFTSLSMGDAHDETQFFTLGLMFIGGASGSTAGGIKVGTFAVIISAAFAAIRGRDHAELASREMPRTDVDRALAVALLSALGVFIMAIALARLEDSMFFLPVLFEATSAFATNGLSTGITPTLDDSALLLLTATMYIGRLGPLTLVLALVQRSAGRELRRLPEERVRIG
jgi:trk system potassium uptake protein TrkH